MRKSDLDWLTAEASPEEVKRLMRIAHEWSQGDENAFPVQLALLTRAQWRAAGKVARLIEESGGLLEKRLADYRQEAVALLKEFSVAADAQAKALTAIVASHAQSVARATTLIGEHTARASQVAEHIRLELLQGAEAWQRARREFEAERERFEEARRQAERRRTSEERIMKRLLLLAMIGLGVAIGLGLKRGILF